MSVTTVEELRTALSGFRDTPDVVFFENQLVGNVSFNPNSAASQRALARYTQQLALAVTNPSSDFILSDMFASLSNAEKAEVIRGIMEPSAITAYNEVADVTRRFHNEQLIAKGAAFRAVLGEMDLSRLQAATAQTIGKSLNNENILGSDALVRGAYQNNITWGKRDTTLNTLGTHIVDQKMGVYRKVTSRNPCTYCAGHDGMPVKKRIRTGKSTLSKSGRTRRYETRAWTMDDEITKFHDHCSCQLELFYE